MTKYTPVKEEEQKHTLNPEANLPTNLHPKEMTEAEKFAAYHAQYDKLVDLCFKNDKKSKSAAKKIYRDLKNAVKKDGDLCAKYFVLQYQILKFTKVGTADLGYIRNRYFPYLLTQEANEHFNSLAFANLASRIKINSLTNFYKQDSYSVFFIAFLLADDNSLLNDAIKEILLETDSPYKQLILPADHVSWQDVNIKTELDIHHIKNYDLVTFITQSLNPKRAKEIYAKLDLFLQMKSQALSALTPHIQTEYTVNNNNNQNKGKPSVTGMFSPSNQTDSVSETSSTLSDASANNLFATYTVDTDALALQLETLRLQAKNANEQAKLFQKQADACKAHAQTYTSQADKIAQILESKNQHKSNSL